MIRKSNYIFLLLLFDYLPSEVETIYSMDQDTDTSFVFSTTGTYANTTFLKSDIDGNLIWEINKGFPTYNNAERIAKFSENELMHFGNRSINLYYEGNFVVQKRSSIDGSVISSWEYGDVGVSNFLEDYEILPEGGFLIAGRRTGPYYYRLALMKLDASGNMLWYNKYRDNSWTTEVIVNKKGNYLLSATTGDQIFAPVVAHPYFIEVSPEGDSITSKYLIVHADTVDEKRNSWTWGMLQNDDGDYVFSISIDSVQQKGGTILDKYAAVVMMDTLFNIKWKVYLNKGEPGGGINYPTRVIELKDSTFICMVMNVDNMDGNTLYLYNISKTGQVLSQKTFTSTLCGMVHATEIKILHDGSMLMSGACGDGENAYIARIDSVGIPMKTLSTFPKKEVQNTFQVEIYPNPFREELNLKIIDNTFSKWYTFILYNHLGQKVEEYTFNTNEYTIDRNTLSSGLYYYNLLNEKGEVKTGKVVVE